MALVLLFFKSISYPRFGLDYGLGAANTANCYYEGWIGIKDKKKYFDYFLKAAEKNYAPSQFNVAVMYKKGEVIDKSMTKAVY